MFLSQRRCTFEQLVGRMLSTHSCIPFGGVFVRAKAARTNDLVPNPWVLIILLKISHLTSGARKKSEKGGVSPSWRPSPRLASLSLLCHSTNEPAIRE